MSAWRGHMFGLALHSEVELAGCRPGAALVGLPLTHLELAERQELRRAWPADAEPVGWRRDGPDERTPDVFAHPTAGYQLPAPGFGTFVIDPQGRRIRAAPNAIATWRWQRYLIGRVLPFAAALQGLEPLHASAVAAPAGAVLIVGDPGAGKSTLAAELLLCGLPLFADDVVALRCGPEGVLAYPGPGVMWLRTPTAQRLGVRALRRLGRRVGGDARGLRLAVAHESTPRPVAAVYLLSIADEGAQPELAAVTDGTPAALLSHTFNAVLRDPARLVRQLEVYGALASSTPIMRLSAPRGSDPSALAALVRAHLNGAG